MAESLYLVMTMDITWDSNECLSSVAQVGLEVTVTESWGLEYVVKLWILW